MVEAELGDGDIGQITQAIQNALRSPTAPPTKRLAAAPSVNDAIEAPEVELETEPADQNEAFDTNFAPVRARGPRKPPPPPPIVQIDMNSEVSLASFVNGKDASSQHKKYLIAAAWLKEHRTTDAVTAGHIYTCFRSLGWSTNIRDFTQPLRHLKSKQLFNRNDKNEYEINHLGLDYVRKLGGSNGTG